MIDSKEWLASLPPPSGALEAVQLRGRNFLSSQALPSRSIESWRYSDIKNIQNLLSLPISLQSNELKYLPNIPTDTCRIVIGSQGLMTEELTLPEGFQRLTDLELEQILGQTLDSCSCSSDWPVFRCSAKTGEGCKALIETLSK